MSGSRNTLFEPLRITDPSVSDNPLLQGTPSQGAALGDLYTAAMAERERQMQISRERGLWTGGEVWQGGHPTSAGVADIGGQYANALLLGTTTPGVRAYHGSPHSFERFDTSKIGTGEGAQAYGHGLYFAENEGTARAYRENLAPLGNLNAQGSTEAAGMAARALQSASPEQAVAGLQERLTYPHIKRGLEANDPETLAFRDKVNQAISLIQKPGGKGSMYEVNIAAEPEHFLHWDKTVGQHPEAVRSKLLDMGYGDADRGADVYSHMARGKQGDVGASQRLQDAGIPGIRYLDQGSRGAGEGSHNYVVFDANTIDILRKYGIAGLMAGGAGAAAATNGSQQPSQ